MTPNLPTGAAFIIKRLEDAGKRAHIVGGCVRDFLLSKTPFDYDITTDALPEEMHRIFSDIKTVDTGIKHGTLTVLFEGEPYEVTTYRVDGEYENHRKPKSVTFSDNLSSDLSRRDFTMNAICYSDRDGFIDEFSGIEDIKNKVIRAVGEPTLRFEEDALRILRALRFASQLGFSIEKKTDDALFEKAHLLSSVSAERIYAEWTKLIGGKFAYEVIDKYRDIISPFLLSEPIVLPEKKKFNEAKPEIRQLSVFLLSHNDPVASFLDFCDRMKTDSRTKREGSAALCGIDAALLTDEDIRLALIELGEKAVKDISALNKTCSIREAPSEDRINNIIFSGYPLSLSELCVNGEDMKALGFFGKEIGEILKALLDLTARDKVKNEREALLRAAEKIKNGI